MSKKVPLKLSGLLEKVERPEDLSAAVSSMPQLKKRTSIVEDILPVEDNSEPDKSRTENPNLPAPDTSNLDTISEGFKSFIKKTGYVPGNYIQVPFDVIDESPVNPRRIYQEDNIKKLALEIQRDGQMFPAVLVINPSDHDRFICIDGHRRIKAIKQHTKLKTIKAEILDINEVKDWYRIGFSNNNNAEKTLDLDNGLAWADMLKKGFFRSQEEIAASTGLDKTTISRAMCYQELPQDVIEVFKKRPEKFSIRFAYEIFLIFKALGLPKALEVSITVLDRDMTFKKLEALKQRLLETHLQPRHSRANKQIVNLDGKPIGSIRQWNDGRMSIEISNLTEEQQEIITSNLYDAISKIELLNKP